MKKNPSLLLAMLILATTIIANQGCAKKEMEPEIPEPPVVPQQPGGGNPIGNNPDSISARLNFYNAEKRTGSIPSAPPSPTIKISISDTLILTDDIKTPVRFQHLDTLFNVSGAYVQVKTSSAAASYYKVPELAETAESDSVSIIFIGINLDDQQTVTAAGEITYADVIITPYDASGQPLATATRHAKIGKRNKNGTQSECGIQLSGSDYWEWDHTQVDDPNGNGVVFYNSPLKIWGAGGQLIKGCCINNISSYDALCANNEKAQRPIRFFTWFQFNEEMIKFVADGSFARRTKEIHNFPEPQQSNFCGNLRGVVSTSRSEVTYTGNWSISSLAAPFKGDSLILSMKTVATSGGTGSGRNGGVIHQLDCDNLTLVQPDREGGGRHEYTSFVRKTPNGPSWFEMEL